MSLSRQDLLLLSGLTFLALMIGWVTGAYGWSFFATSVLWSLGQYRERVLLARWSHHPLSRPASEQDAWQHITLPIYQSLRRARNRHALTLRRFKSLRAITDSLPDAAVILDEKGHIENLNIAAQEMLNLSSRDKGTSLASLVREPAFAALVRGEVDGDLAEMSSPYHEEARLEARRIQMSQDQTMILVRDVTELNRLLSMRQDFIANVSHELRTPLTVIVGYIETLMNEELDRETTLELINKLLSPTARMRALVDDLLLLTRLESSPSPSIDELSPVDMSVLMNAIVADARALSAGRHDIRIKLGSRAQVMGIDSELHSACLNLLTNAVRYSPDGGEICVSWEETTDGARFSVKDSGMGIAREHLSRLTERFYRVDLAQARVRGGTGLGLAIVKHVLKRHNTELEVDSELTRGSTFSFEFPSSQLA
jgi:two-component system phosphate regulon sensor histidine kinase PhoR